MPKCSRCGNEISGAELRHSPEAKDDELVCGSCYDGWGTAYIVLTELNGYRNIYGHVLFRHVEQANEAAEQARSLDKWDQVYVTCWDVL